LAKVIFFSYGLIKHYWLIIYFAYKKLNYYFCVQRIKKNSSIEIQEILYNLCQKLKLNVDINKPYFDV